MAGKNGTNRPLNGILTTLSVNWGVSHFSEEGCAGPIAGADVTATGDISHLGASSTNVSAAWDWGTPAAGVYSPVGPTTIFSATVLPSPYVFCSSAVTATGVSTLTAANGDTISGIVTGGEVYELFLGAFPGDGQESFIAVTITGGTGRFSGASGKFVSHSIISFLTGLVSNDISGRISY